MNTYIGKLESLEERCPHLESENTLLQPQLEDVRNNSLNNEKTVIKSKGQLHDIIKILQVQTEKEGHILEERNKELINELNHFKKYCIRRKL